MPGAKCSGQWDTDYKRANGKHIHRFRVYGLTTVLTTNGFAPNGVYGQKVANQIPMSEIRHIPAVDFQFPVTMGFKRP